MPSRAAANTSGRTSSRAFPSRSFSRLWRAFRRSLRRSESGALSSSSDGSSGAAISTKSARMMSTRSRISASVRDSYSGSSALIWSTRGWMREISRSLVSKKRERKRMAG